VGLAKTPCPDDRTIYVASESKLENLAIYSLIKNKYFGGMPIQIGYCNGYNTKLNCLEWHRGSELNIPSNDIVLLVAPLCAVKNGILDTSMVEAFYAPKGTIVQVYETTLHYAPCNGVKDGEVSKEGFRVIIVLPRDTNTDKPSLSEIDFEDKLLWAKNKWLIAHPDSNEAKNGAFVGLKGPNIDLAN
jgi:hypothetical protein